MIISLAFNAATYQVECVRWPLSARLIKAINCAPSNKGLARLDDVDAARRCADELRRLIWVYNDAIEDMF